MSEITAYGNWSIDEVLALPHPRHGECGVSLAEIRLASTAEGWRWAIGFGLTKGDCWGSWSPIFRGAPALPTRTAAVVQASDRLRKKLAGRADLPEVRSIFRWLDGLQPAQQELFA